MEALRGQLQTLTRALPAPLMKFGLSQLGPDCYKTLVMDIDLSSTKCLKLGVSKGLGLGIVAASGIVKIPQIIKLLDSQSAAGISFLSYLLETASYVVMIAYSARNGFPFSTYGELALIGAQNIIITLLVLRFQGKTAAAGVFIASLVAAAWALQNESLVDMKTLGYIQAGAGTLGLVSKLPQIYTIWSEGGTGQLSAFTVFNYLAGSISRIFTTLQEVDDKLVLYGFIAGFLLNLIIAGQVIYYWNSPTSKAKMSGKGKGKKAIKTGSIPSSGASSSIESKTRGPSTRRRA